MEEAIDSIIAECAKRLEYDFLNRDIFLNGDRAEDRLALLRRVQAYRSEQVHTDTSPWYSSGETIPLWYEHG